MEELKEQIQTRCLEKEEPFCGSACPFHLDVREFILRMQRGSFNGAFRLFSNTVGFPAIVAALCDEPCKAVCPRSETDEAIALRLLEKAALNHAVNTRPNSYNLPPKPQKIAVIGGGLSGLACVLRLTNKKYQVTLFEKEGDLGGHLCNLLKPEIFLEEFERQFMYETYELHKNREVETLEEILPGFDAVYVATGKGGSSFGLLEEVSERSPGPRASSLPGVFLGGSLLGATTMEALAQGLLAATLVESWLKTGNMKDAAAVAPTKMRLAPGALAFVEPVRPEKEDAYTREEAKAEARRCIRCRCDACFRHCALMTYFEKLPRRIEEEVEITIHPGTLDGNGTVATRFISTCNQCGLCGEICPEKIDMGLFLRKSHQAMRAKGAMPWAFHDFWLRDMEFANGDRASFCAAPDGYDESEFLFFPGCQLGASDPRYVSEVYRFLRSQKPDTALSLACCGAPAVWAGDEGLHGKVQERLRDEWQSLGEPKLLFACASCLEMFREFLPEIEGVLLYEVLSRWGFRPRNRQAEEVASVFDPCASRHQAEAQRKVRELAERSGYRLVPLPYEGREAQCCSWGGQISIANPAYAEWLADRRAREGEAPYIVYCSNCRDIFADRGKPVRHILDVLFDLSGWDRSSPTFSARRRNREELKRSLLREFWPGREVEERNMNEFRRPKLLISPELEAKLSREHILEEDVLDVISFCESCGRKIWSPEQKSFTGYREVGKFTLWVEYEPCGEDFKLRNAYSHRMRIELEEVWNGRKQKIDL